MKKEEKTKRRCPICDEELSEDEAVCPNCGACQNEPCYGIEDDMDYG